MNWLGGKWKIGSLIPFRVSVPSHSVNCELFLFHRSEIFLTWIFFFLEFPFKLAWELPEYPHSDKLYPKWDGGLIQVNLLYLGWSGSWQLLLVLTAWPWRVNVIYLLLTSYIHQSDLIFNCHLSKTTMSDVQLLRFTACLFNFYTSCGIFIYLGSVVWSWAFFTTNLPISLHRFSRLSSKWSIFIRHPVRCYEGCKALSVCESNFPITRRTLDLLNRDENIH